MTDIIFRTTDPETAQTLYRELQEELRQQDWAANMTVSEPQEEVSDEAHRGDPVTIMTIALSALGGGGALVALLGKDGFLVALAKVLEQKAKNERIEVTVEKNGEKKHIAGTLGDVKAVLNEIKE